jgi:hypothetical protein
MTTRTYYMPKNRISMHLINYMVTHVGCSIGKLEVNKVSDTIKVPVTCNDADIKKIERILIRYDMLEG